MDWALAFLGAAILAATTFDLIWTTLALSGAGPLTRGVSRAVGTALLRCHRWRGLRGLSSHAGLGVILATLAAWVLLTWAGWSLLFNADELAVVEGQGGRAAGVADRIYFAGYSLITLGVGDYRPRGAAWQIATVLAAINGFVLISLSVSYLVPILSAAVEGRRLALSIAHLGERPEEIVARGWNGTDFGPLGQHLMELAPPLLSAGQRLLAYPVLLDFRGTDPRASLPVSMAVLDDALTLLERGVAPGVRPEALALSPARRAIAETLEMVIARAGIEPRWEAPPPPPLVPLRAVGVPTIDDAAFRAAVEELDLRRRKLLVLVHRLGWSWPDSAPG